VNTGKVGADDFVAAGLAEADLMGLPRETLGPGDYIESIGQFLDEEDAPLEMIFPDLLPCGVIMLIHGEPRSRKSLLAFELALSASTGRRPSGSIGLRRPCRSRCCTCRRRIRER
jgi:hypothetical protein